MFGSLTKIPVRQLKILILNPLSLLVYNKNMSAYYMYTQLQKKPISHVLGQLWYNK